MLEEELKGVAYCTRGLTVKIRRAVKVRGVGMGERRGGGGEEEGPGGGAEGSGV